jgi:CrcB protein
VVAEAVPEQVLATSSPVLAPGRPRGWPRLRPAVLAVIFAGGVCGGLARYGVTEAWTVPGGGFPWPVFVVNTSGAFVLALLLVLALEVLPPTTYLRPAVGTGFLGAFTTFSSVVASTDQLAAHDHPGIAAAYVGGSVVAGVSAAVVGVWLGRLLGAARHRGRDSRSGGG